MRKIKKKFRTAASASQSVKKLCFAGKTKIQLLTTSCPIFTIQKSHYLKLQNISFSTDLVIYGSVNFSFNYHMKHGRRVVKICNGPLFR